MPPCASCASRGTKLSSTNRNGFTAITNRRPGYAMDTPLLFPGARLLRHCYGINVAVVGQHVEFAIGVLGKTGDVLWLRQKRAVGGDLAVVVSQSINGSESVIR